jgi:PepSY-associated TM region
MRLLVLFHRWLGVACCLPVGMWFATGIVMHFVPFPQPQEDERIAPAPIDFARVKHGPGEAVATSGVGRVTRVRLIERNDGPVYLIDGAPGTKALRADNLEDGTIRTEPAALTIAIDHARRHAGPSPAAAAGVVTYDQWTLSAEYNRHRPLYRIALDDAAGTQLYVSSTTGEVVLTTTSRTRAWNYAGSILHWIYFAALRSHSAVWHALMWWLSLLALFAVAAGSVIGTARMKISGGHPVSPFRGWQAWHHWLGLGCLPFLFTWLFSGWLSLDDGRLFSTGRPAAAETAALVGEPAWDALPLDAQSGIRAPVGDVSWFAFGGRIYRSEREVNGPRHLFVAERVDQTANLRQAFLRPEQIDAAARRLSAHCESAFLVPHDDTYAPAAVMRDRPVFRIVCGDDWFHVDATNGALLEKLDPSRRRYRWLYQGLHKLDVPALRGRPAVRTILIVLLCAGGLIFSVTAMVIAARRVVCGAQRQ